VSGQPIRGKWDIASTSSSSGFSKFASIAFLLFEKVRKMEKWEIGWRGTGRDEGETKERIGKTDEGVTGRRRGGIPEDHVGFHVDQSIK
jgi:hypothetical protein